MARDGPQHKQGKQKIQCKGCIIIFSDSYIEHVFLFGIPDHLKAEANKWRSYYIELMQHKKDPGYGGTKCRGCILCPHTDTGIGIHKVIARGLEPEKKEGEEYTPIYPCPVVNIYNCPYGKVVNRLFAAEEFAHAVSLAFLKAYEITKSNDTIYDTDFAAGKVNEIITLYNGDSHSWGTKYPIEEKLPRVEGLSIVLIEKSTVTTNHDVTAILVTRF